MRDSCPGVMSTDCVPRDLCTGDLYTNATVVYTAAQVHIQCYIMTVVKIMRDSDNKL